MANDAAGTTWDTSVPALSDVRSLGQQEIRGLRAGIALRMNREHETLAAASAGGWHKAGSAKAYTGAAPANRPDGATALTADDDGRVLVDAERVLKVYEHPSFMGVIGAAAEGNTEEKTDFDTAAGWNNNTGYPVFVMCGARHTATIKVEVDYGGGFVELVQSIQTSASSGQFMVWCCCFLPNGAKIRLNPDSVAATVRMRYQDLTTP